MRKRFTHTDRLCVLVQIGKASGCLESWEVGGRALLAEPMRPAFFRAPTDNDLGGSNNISFAVRCAPHSSAPHRLLGVLDETPVEVQVSGYTRNMALR